MLWPHTLTGEWGSSVMLMPFKRLEIACDWASSRILEQPRHPPCSPANDASQAASSACRAYLVREATAKAVSSQAGRIIA